MKDGLHPLPDSDHWWFGTSSAELRILYKRHLCPGERWSGKPPPGGVARARKKLTGSAPDQRGSVRAADYRDWNRRTDFRPESFRCSRRREMPGDLVYPRGAVQPEIEDWDRIRSRSNDDFLTAHGQVHLWWRATRHGRYCLGAMPFPASSAIASGVFSRWANPMPSRT